MKKTVIILGNILIVLAIIAFVITYAGSLQRQNLSSRTEAFENMTVAMERVTAIYMNGEQRVCDSWANYISTNPMSMHEAAAYVRSAVTSEDIMGHILYTDGEQALKGLSTVPRTKAKTGADPFEVSYGSIFENGFGDYFRSSNTVNVTKSFTNPINGRQSVAFCHFIPLRETPT